MDKTKLESEYMASIQALRTDCEQLRRQVFEQSRFMEDSQVAGEAAPVDQSLRRRLSMKESMCNEYNKRVEVLFCLLGRRLYIHYFVT